MRHKQDKGTFGFHQFRVLIQSATSQNALYKIIKEIDENWKKNGLNEFDVKALEDIGLRKFEQLEKEAKFLIKNRKH